jgi:hypothetical protein
MVFGFIPECRSASSRKERSAGPESPARALPDLEVRWRVDQTSEAYVTVCRRNFRTQGEPLTPQPGKAALHCCLQNSIRAGRYRVQHQYQFVDEVLRDVGVE